MEVIMVDMVTEVTAEVTVEVTEVTEEATEVTMDNSQKLKKPKLSFQKQAMQCWEQIKVFGAWFEKNR